MKTRTPPALATRILNWLVANFSAEPLAGDLIESYRSGKSAFWFWRQTLWAVSIAFGRRFRARSAELRAVLIGSGSQAALFYGIRSLPGQYRLAAILLSAAVLILLTVALHRRFLRKLDILWETRDLSEQEIMHRVWHWLVPTYVPVSIFALNMAFCLLVLALDRWVRARIELSIDSTVWFALLQAALPVGEAWSFLERDPPC